jgi:hypothetical protein
MFTTAFRLKLPRAVAHPAKTATKSLRRRRLRKRVPLAS